MNAILSLCHFCELHGPKIIFNTQTFRDVPSLSSIGLSNDQDPILIEKNREFLWKYGRVDKTDALKCQPTNAVDTCQACRSFPHNKAAVITNDDENQVSFVSSQFPFQEEVFTLLRQAGIRSLSCEAYSEREGPIYFGDHSRGHVISYTFFLKDIQARGFLKRYSILVMMADKMFLLNSWSFFIKYIQDIIKYLQESAYKVNVVEQKHAFLQKGLKPPVSSDISKRQRTVSNPRPLTDLVGDKSVWTTLHTKFTWILKVGGVRLQEKLVEGPPLFVPKAEQRTFTLHSLMSLMTAEHFEKMIHHIYIGSKILFESHDLNLLSEIPLVLKPIIPLYLYRPCVLNSADDVIDKIANIIIVSSSSLNDSFRDIFSVKIVDQKPSEEKTVGTSVSFQIQVNEPSHLKSRPPQIVSKLCSLIGNGRFSNSVLNLYFSTLIDEWTNKIKIWSFINGNRQVLNFCNHSDLKAVCNQAQSSDKKGILQLSQTPSPGACFPSIGTGYNTLLTVVGALECDVPMLNALSTAYEIFNQSL